MDHINKKWGNSQLDVRNKSSTDAGSDYHMLTEEIRMKVSTWKIKEGNTIYKNKKQKKLKENGENFCNKNGRESCKGGQELKINRKC